LHITQPPKPQGPITGRLGSETQSLSCKHGASDKLINVGKATLIGGQDERGLRKFLRSKKYLRKRAVHAIKCHKRIELGHAKRQKGEKHL